MEKDTEHKAPGGSLSGIAEEFAFVYDGTLVSIYQILH
jgi:hypothetical protein